MALSQQDIQQINALLQRIIDANEATIKEATKDFPKIKEAIGTINKRLERLESANELQTTLLKSLQLNHEMLQDKLLHQNAAN